MDPLLLMTLLTAVLTVAMATYDTIRRRRERGPWRTLRLVLKAIEQRDDK